MSFNPEASSSEPRPVVFSDNPRNNADLVRRVKEAVMSSLPKPRKTVDPADVHIQNGSSYASVDSLQVPDPAVPRYILRLLE